jgi:hypothetical protein
MIGPRLRTEWSSRCYRSMCPTSIGTRIDLCATGSTRTDHVTTCIVSAFVKNAFILSTVCSCVCSCSCVCAFTSA